MRRPLFFTSVLGVLSACVLVAWWTYDVEGTPSGKVTPSNALTTAVRPASPDGPVPSGETGTGAQQLSKLEPPTAPEPSQSAPRPAAMRIERKIEDQLADNNGGLQTDLARKQLFGNYDNLVAELEREMATSHDSQELAELYSAQMKVLLEQQGSNAALDRMLCGQKMCLAELATPNGGVPPRIGAGDMGLAGVPLSGYQSVQFTSPDGRLTIRFLFTFPRS